MGIHLFLSLPKVQERNGSFINARCMISRLWEKSKDFFHFPQIFLGLYTSTARPALKNQRQRRLTSTPAAWDRARV